MRLKTFILILIIAVAAVTAYFAYHTRNTAQNYHFSKSSNQAAVLPLAALGPAAAETTPAPAAPQQMTQQVTLIAAGDIMLSRSVAGKIRDHDIYYPFASIKNYLHSGDIVFANLECPITPGPVVKSGSFTFHADPGVEAALKDAGFTILNLANNHTPNYGAAGILDTLKYLDAAGIAHIGAGKDLAQADQAVYIEKNGIKFAFLGYNDSDVVPPSYGAAAGHAGTNIMSVEKVQRDVKLARQHADIVIVSMHSGIEYTPGPDNSQKNFAHAAIDAGANMVIGHHPHVIQTIEQYKGKYIFYSLGNFVFDQAFSKEVQEGMTLKITFDKTGPQKVEYNPVWIEDLSQPHLVTDQKLLSEEIARLGPAAAGSKH